MTRLVVDINVLRTKDVGHYLAASRDNIVVIADETCMESYGGRTLANIEKSVRYIQQFPRQVFVLKPWRVIVRDQSECNVVTAEGLVDWAQTRDLNKFFVQVAKAVNGDVECEDAIMANASAARDYLDGLLVGAEGVASGIVSIAARMDPKRRRRFITGVDWDASDIRWFLALVKQLTEDMAGRMPRPIILPRDTRLWKGLWLFRYATAAALLVKTWIANNGIENVKMERLRNDIVDASVATSATYFDGLATKDNKMNQVYSELSWVVHEALG